MEANSSYYLIPRLFSIIDYRALTNEAELLYAYVKEQKVYQPDIKNRGGMPARKLKSVGGGRVQTSLYHSQELIDYMSQKTNSKITQSGKRGTFSYYTEVGDFLDTHRDRNICDLTLITCLINDLDSHSGSGTLYLYDKRIEENIHSIYQDRMWGYKTIFLQAGESILIKGGVLPHGVNPLLQNGMRCISAMCFTTVS